MSKDEGAKAYLHRHNLHLLFEHMAYKVLSDRPEDPVRHLFDQLGAKIGVNTAGISSQPPQVPDYRIVFVMGGPGSGKGTQCEKLTAKGLATYVSSGDLLRKEQESNTPEGQAIKDDLAAGRLVPKATVIALLKKFVFSQPKGTTVLLDGFPREMGQALSFETDIQPCDFVLYFACPDEELEKRLLKRGVTSGRADDNITTIKSRLKVFHEETQAAIEYYKALNKLREIDATRSVDDIFADVESHFQAPLDTAAPAAAPTVEEEEEL